MFHFIRHRTANLHLDTTRNRRSFRCLLLHCQSPFQTKTSLIPMMPQLRMVSRYSSHSFSSEIRMLSDSLGSTPLIDHPISTCKIEIFRQVASMRSLNKSFSTIFCSFPQCTFHRALILSTKKCRYYINVMYCVNVTGHKPRRILLCCLRKTSTPPRIFSRNQPRR